MMEEYREGKENEDRGEFAFTGMNRWLVIAAVALLAIAGVAFGYGYRQQALVGHLTAQQSVANATISDMQGQLGALTAKLNDMTAAQAAAAAAAASQQAKNASKKGAPVDKRYKQLQAQLADQQKQLKDTQDLVAKNKTDIETSLTSTRDELNGSIAKTHEELVVLQKRGERNYFEFDLTKAKQFQRFGPLSLSLRRTDAKHMNYDMMMVVDDNPLTKKRVNLYEPIWIHTENEAQPVQVVVNKISKNFVHGYISAPKYRPSELATTSSSGNVTPVSAKTTPDPNRPNQQQPEQQPEQQQPPPLQPQQPEPPRP